MTSPIRPTEESARQMARDLIGQARFGAIATLDPVTKAPMVTRIAVGLTPTGLHILISDLSLHTQAIKADPACSLLIGEPGPKGDPLTHPRLTLQCRASPTPKSGQRNAWLQTHPKAALYVDFTDFDFYRLDVAQGFLNGGFGKAFHLTPQDMALTSAR